ncbi:MAG TPA: glycosyltransferase, partial [Chloroflexia bacterium]|nr:glycosyltransferase [Chloroflexia bacterium]
MTQRERALIILPTYNEHSNLQPITEAILAVGPFHILVVDDNSPDGTGQLADELAAQQPDRLFVLHRAAKEGLGKAYLAGFAWGLAHDYTLLFEMDADFSHDPRHLPQFVNRVREGS